MLGWVKLSADRNTYSCVFSFENGAQFIELITDPTGTTLALFDHVSGQVATFGTLTVGTAYKVGLWIGSGTYKVWLGVEGTPGVTEYTGTCTTLSALAYQGIGTTSGDPDNEWLNGVFSRVRAGNGSITEAEVEAEFASESPLYSGIIGSWFPRTMTAATALSAQTGANLVDGAGSGTAAYTVEAAPVVDTAGSPSVTGTIAATLATDTSSATGTHGIVGSVAPTLAAATASAVGTHGVTGTTTTTLAAATATATGAHGVRGPVAGTLAAATMSSVAAHGVSGTTAATLAAATCAAAGVHGVTGTVTPTLAAATSAITGAHTGAGVSGSIVTTLGAASMVSAGSVGVGGTVNATLAPTTATVAGVHGVGGTVSPTLAAATVAVTGAHGVGGSVVTTLSAATGDVLAGHGVSGSIACVLAATTADIAGWFGTIEAHYAEPGVEATADLTDIVEAALTEGLTTAHTDEASAALSWMTGHPTLAQDLRAFWKMNGDLSDATGQVPTGDVIAGGWGYWVGFIPGGKQDQYLVAGTGHAAVVGLGTSPLLKPTTGLSVSAWVKNNGTPDYNCRFLGDWHQSATLDRWLFFFTSGAPNIARFGLCNANETQVWNQPFGLIGTEWTHLCATWSQADGVRQYVNGVQVQAGAFNVPALNASVGSQVTAIQQAEVGGPLYGGLDDVGLWGRALTAAEVVDLYAGGAGSRYPF